MYPSVPNLERSEVMESLQNIQALPEEFKELFLAAMNQMKEELKQQVREDVRNEVIEEVRKEIASASEQQQLSIESGNKQTSEKIRELSESLKMEVNRRDEVLMENMNLMRELREEKQKGF